MNETPLLSPLAALGLLEKSFFEYLGKLSLGAEERSIRTRIGDLAPKTRHLVHNELDEGNVGFTLLAVAAYDVLQPQLGREKALHVVDACLNEPLRAWVLEGTAGMLDASPDPFESITRSSREREAHYFGPSFAFERPVDDGFGYVLHVRRCLFHETLRALERTEVQPVLCRFDLNWIDGIDPARHRMRFARPSTFATADLCRMWFMRLEPPMLLKKAHGKTNP
ncbi:L-2-amino-thiazoline-4-carboxylic acid hydrolase [Pendulispora rubella]|uniref:L-2-amino-thiazoline-4-carboxylic acid hydrolase n=1 Tax=Pendulispora rubella TaxID=2741070 RepID=A0ABZ2LMZ7_9BACT